MSIRTNWINYHVSQSCVSQVDCLPIRALPSYRVSSTPRNPPVQPSRDARADFRAPLIVTLALVAGVLGAVALALGPWVGVGTGPGASGAAASASVFAALCAIAVPAAAIMVARRDQALAGALLAGVGSVSVGVAILDIQLFVDAIDANRLEFFRPVSAGTIGAGAGAYVVIVGHILLIVAGALGLVVIHRESERDGYGSAGAAEYDGRTVGGRIGVGPTSLLILAAGVYALSLFARDFDSHDPIFLVHTLVDSPAANALGAAVVAIAVLIVTASALTSVSPAVGSGALIGAGVGALSVSGTRVVAGLASDDRIGVGMGSIIGALAALALLGVGAAIPVISARREAIAALASTQPRTPTPPRATKAATKNARTAEIVRQAREAQARVTKLHRFAGALGVLTAALAFVGGALPALTLPAGLPEPSIPATRIVVVSATVLLLVSFALFAPGRAPSIRPVAATLWTTLVMGVAAVLQPVVVATDIAGVGLGSGVFVLGVASVAAVSTGLTLWLAGTAEREEIDTSVEFESNNVVRVVGGVGGVLTLVGTALPLYRGENHNAASITEWPWGIDTWGQLLVGTAVLAASLTAGRARPARAVALLVGSSLSAAIYLAFWPLTSSRIPDATVGAGAIATGAGLLLIIVAAIFSVVTMPSARAARQ